MSASRRAALDGLVFRKVARDIPAGDRRAAGRGRLRRGRRGDPASASARHSARSRSGASSLYYPGRIQRFDSACWADGRQGPQPAAAIDAATYFWRMVSFPLVQGTIHFAGRLGFSQFAAVAHDTHVRRIFPVRGARTFTGPGSAASRRNGWAGLIRPLRWTRSYNHRPTRRFRLDSVEPGRDRGLFRGLAVTLALRTRR